MQRNGFELPSLDEPLDPDILSNQWQMPRHDQDSTRQWNDTYLVQASRRKQGEEKQKIIGRIFGPNSDGEDNDLCIRMIDYFDRYCLTFLD